MLDLLVGFCAAAIGLSAYLRDRRPVARSFLLFTSSIAVWLVSYGLLFASLDERAALVWAHTGYLGIALIPAAVFQFAVQLLRQRDGKRKLIPVLWSVSTLLAILGAGTDFIVSGTKQYWWGWYPQLAWIGSLSVIYIACVIGFVLFMFFAALQRDNETFSIAVSSCSQSPISSGHSRCSTASLSFGVPLYPSGVIGILGYLFFALLVISHYGLADRNGDFSPHQILDDDAGQCHRRRPRRENPLHQSGHHQPVRIPSRRTDRQGNEPLIESPLNVGRASDTLMRGGKIRNRAMIWRDSNGSAGGSCCVRGHAAERRRFRRQESSTPRWTSEIGSRPIRSSIRPITMR